VRAPANSSRRAARCNRPALDEPRGIERPAGAGVEEAARAPAQGLAAREHAPDVWAGVGRGELAAGNAADLAVGAVGAERRVDRMQPGEDVVDCGRRHRVVQLDLDGHAHEVLAARDGGC